MMRYFYQNFPLGMCDYILDFDAMRFYVLKWL